MTESNRSPKVDAFLGKAGKWRAEFEALRAILLDGGLSEELKWGWPCYTLDKRNIVLMHGFKDYCALLFFKGALLTDPGHILIQQTENVQAGRQVRFAGASQIIEMEALLKTYVREAIELEASGARVSLKKTSEFVVPEEFQTRLDEDPALKAAFGALTPGRQRAYLLHFASAKQSKTRAARVETAIPKIYEGKGLDDR
jgi:uncharacterized protein YdeI (YjbR/CyaY-like superfamily)